MDATARPIGGFEHFPTALRRYLIAVSIAGPLVAVAVAIGARQIWSGRDGLFVVLLTALGILAERYNLQLTHHTRISVNTAIYVAMMIVLPWGVVGVLALGSISVADIWRRRDQRLLDIPEMLFNTGQGALFVAAGAVCFGLLDRQWPEPRIADRARRSRSPVARS